MSSFDKAIYLSLPFKSILSEKLSNSFGKFSNILPAFTCATVIGNL